VMLRQHWEQLRYGTTRDDAKREAELEAIWGEGIELIDESLEGIARTSAIVRGIREFSHAGNAVRTPVDLAEVVRAAQRMAMPKLPAGVELELDLAELPAVSCAPREIQQVVLNLLINAADAVGECGTIRVRTRREGDRVRLSVRDDGEGIPEESLDRIFDPFFTTKDVGEGSGLGLSISYEIVARHGGEIVVESKLGKGTTFSVILPFGAA